jgi:hypothetical protein
MMHLLSSRIGASFAALVLALTACGGGTFVPPPINLSVSVNNATVMVTANGTAVNVPVTIIAPTETATFNITGLPAGVSESYKESESNPSGLLTLVANSTTVPGTYMPTITVGSSGQTASVVFTLVITAPPKPGFAKRAGAGTSGTGRIQFLLCGANNSVPGPKGYGKFSQRRAWLWPRRNGLGT